jgi:ubiquinone/menaquinone biosynthesis C-methylase UbiE
MTLVAQPPAPFDWGSSSLTSAWLRAAEQRNRMLAAATERMFAFAGIGEGSRVLDVGTGTGDTALMLAHRVGPAGEVVATDNAPAMVEAATRAARASGLGHVDVVLHDIGAAPLRDVGTFDAATARNVLMFLNDIPRAVSFIRAVLRPRARLAAVVWAEPGRNPFQGILIDSVRARGDRVRPIPEIEKQFVLSSPEVLAHVFERAGFESVVVERVPTAREFDSLSTAMRFLDDVPLYREPFSALSGTERVEALAEIERAYGAFVGANGRTVFPAESLVVAGSA